MLARPPALMMSARASGCGPAPTRTAPAHPPSLAERGYRTIVSSPVPLNLEDLTLDRAAGTHSADAAAALLARADAQRAGEENGAIEDEEEEEETEVVQEASAGGGSRAGSMQDVSGAVTAGSEADGGALGEPAGGLVCRVVGQLLGGRHLYPSAPLLSRLLLQLSARRLNIVPKPIEQHLSPAASPVLTPIPPHPTPTPPLAASALRKVYRPLYVWGQLSSWFKQTVNDPTASLSAERRGTLALPDVESAFAGGRARYSPKVRFLRRGGALRAAVVLCIRCLFAGAHVRCSPKVLSLLPSPPFQTPTASLALAAGPCRLGGAARAAARRHVAHWHPVELQERGQGEWRRVSGDGVGASDGVGLSQLLPLLRHLLGQTVPYPEAPTALHVAYAPAIAPQFAGCCAKTSSIPTATSSPGVWQPRAGRRLVRADSERREPAACGGAGAALRGSAAPHAGGLGHTALQVGLRLRASAASQL